MIPRQSSVQSSASQHEDLAMIRAWEANDYIDIDALISRGGVDLSTALAAGQKLYGPSFNPEITLKALSYFEDGDLKSLPRDVKDRLAAAVREVDLEHLPSLEQSLHLSGPDEGYGL